MDPSEPSSSQTRSSEVQRTSPKRKSYDSIELNRWKRPPKRRQLLQETTKTFQTTSSPIAYWAETSYWPKSCNQEALKMSLPSQKKQKNSTTHFSIRQQRLENEGIHRRIAKSPHLLQVSKDFCRDLVNGDRRPNQFPCYPAEKADDVLERVESLNEARLQRDVTPWVVPSAENLWFSGKLAHDYIGEEVQALWTRCEPIGGPKPKPDFAVGLRRSAFNNEEWAKLDNCTTSSKPFYTTSDLWFPFLICEAKTGQAGLDLADLQNMHSGSIAVRSILRVCIAAYGRHHQKVNDLFGRILVFTVSHNNQRANIYGHYAVAKDESNDKDEAFEYFRYGISSFSIGGFADATKHMPYNFVRNLYDKFAPEHRDRLRDAISALVKPGPRAGIYFDEYSISSSAGESQPDQKLSQQGGVVTMPGEPADAETSAEMSRLMTQLEQQTKEMEQQRKESKEQLDTLLRQLEQQRKESRDEREQMEQRRKEEMEQMRREKDQLMNMFLSAQRSQG